MDFFLSRFCYQTLQYNKQLGVIFNKKTLFFKKSVTKKVLISKRLSVVLKKKTKVLRKKNELGSFFFKKFFFKTLIKSRKTLRHLFFLKPRTRQSKITKTIIDIDNFSVPQNRFFEYSLFNILLRSYFFFFVAYINYVLCKNYIRVNNKIAYKYNQVLGLGDCIQLPLTTNYFRFFKKCKRFFKAKIKLLRYNA